MAIYVWACEMINDAVMPNKYEIPGSLAGLDWREKCIISPWMHSSLGVIDIITSVLPQRDRGRDRHKRERKREV